MKEFGYLQESIGEVKMGILPNLLWVTLNLVCIGLDITIFFLFVRLIITWLKIPLFEKFNDAGKSLVGAITSSVSTLWDRVGQKRLSEKGKVFLGIAVVAFIRLILGEFGRLLLR